VHVLFVCSGNICRSPFAEALARSLAEGFEFSSAGTIARSGDPASAGGITVAAGLGVDMRGHRASHLTAEILADVDIVYAMEEEHIATVLTLDPGARVELLSPDGAAIPDPYGGDDLEYAASYSLIVDAIKQRFTESD
jgi:protein-tyrosine-phosphatase